ncbi:hypothetical protein L6164_028637 [Bauhinia variegata]|uniref:Uncharacterized protein n=1 Tax=Bauhinia variegata TaxID=167791 RepID=A0ACB9L844_BAUVA|nr:hypothetical protein L6164_028637 [Bauhinia variegata]
MTTHFVTVMLSRTTHEIDHVGVTYASSFVGIDDLSSEGAPTTNDLRDAWWISQEITTTSSLLTESNLGPIRSTLRGSPNSVYGFDVEACPPNVRYGFQKSRSDASLFVFKRGELTAYFLVYVDDLLLTGNSSKFLNEFQSALSLKFSLKDLGFPSYFLGMEVLPTTFGLILNQHKYLRDLLHRFDMDGSKAVQTPISTSTTLLPRDGSAPADASLYRKIIGSLQYLNLTRPDVAFSINKLSQFMQAPT